MNVQKKRTLEDDVAASLDAAKRAKQAHTPAKEEEAAAAAARFSREDSSASASPSPSPSQKVSQLNSGSDGGGGGGGGATHAAPFSSSLFKDNVKDMEKEKEQEAEEEEEVCAPKLSEIASLVREEEERIEALSEVSKSPHQLLHERFNELQAIGKDIGQSFEIPEIVVVGMQSDGKSSLLEGLLGFQFNVVDSNIGTRRPLIIQMQNNDDFDSPDCTFRKEHASGSDDFEARATPVHALQAEILARTDAIAGAGDAVSEVPIILRVRYRYCANLTVYDMPGWRIGGDERIRKQVNDVVEKALRPSHRLILCLEQSTVEWSNSISRPYVAEFDPLLRRTIIVRTKFDNRVKELRTAKQAKKFLLGEDLPSVAPPIFFISMPLRRNLSAERFQREIQRAHMDDFTQLAELGVLSTPPPPSAKCAASPAAFGERLGVFRLRRTLESLLVSKYREATLPTLRLLEQTCNDTETNLKLIEEQLNSNNIDKLHTTIIAFSEALSQTIISLFNGSIEVNPAECGYTTHEEATLCGTAWPSASLASTMRNSSASSSSITTTGVADATQSNATPHSANDLNHVDAASHELNDESMGVDDVSQMKLFGGAALRRLFDECSTTLESIEFPKLSQHELATARGFANAPEEAALNIAKIKIRKSFFPFIELMVKRASFNFQSLFKLALSALPPSDQFRFLTLHKGFILAIEDEFNSLLKVRGGELAEALKKDFDLLLSDEFLTARAAVGNDVTRIAASFFNAAQAHFSTLLRTRAIQIFHKPIQQKLTVHMVNYARDLSGEDIASILELGLAELEAKYLKLKSKKENCLRQKSKFQELVKSFSS